MKTNVTLRLDADLLREVRVLRVLQPKRGDQSAPLVYAHDSSAGKKHTRARALVEELWRNRTGALSTQVLQELVVNLRRKAGKPLNTRATREIVADYLSWHVVMNSGDSVMEALDIEQRYRISFWDALIVHAVVLGGSLQWTGLRRHARHESVLGQSQALKFEPGDRIVPCWKISTSACVATRQAPVRWFLRRRSCIAPAAGSASPWHRPRLRHPRRRDRFADAGGAAGRVGRCPREE